MHGHTREKTFSIPNMIADAKVYGNHRREAKVSVNFACNSSMFLKNRPFQRGLGRRATFLEDGGYTGIFAAMLNWSCSGKSCEQNMEFNSSYMVHERPEGLQHENKYLLIT